MLFTISLHTLNSRDPFAESLKNGVNGALGKTHLCALFLILPWVSKGVQTMILELLLLLTPVRPISDPSEISDILERQ